jgi:hypothetical protein
MMTSGPASTTIAMSDSCASGEFAIEVMPTDSA